MATAQVNLDTTQYVRVTQDPIRPVSLLLQSHRDAVRIVVSDAKPSFGNPVFHELSGSDDILSLSLAETHVWALATTDRCGLTVTEQRVPVEVSNRGSIGASVFVNDQTTAALDIPFLLRIGSTTLAAPATKDIYVVQLSPGHGVIVGNVIEIASPTTFMQATVLSVVGDSITLDNLVNHAYPAGTPVEVSSRDLRVDGSVTPQVFAIAPTPDQSGDITRIIIGLQSTTAMDFSTFGSLPTLTRGCLLRVRKPDGDYVNLFNWKSNGGFAIRSFDTQFQSKIGGGLHSFIARTTYAGQSQRGVVIRLDGGKGVVPPERLELVVQDNLSVGLAEFIAVAQGHELQEY